MISVYDFVGRVERIAARNLRYKIGGVGKNGVCDCTGLIMGAMYELGHKTYDMHSTNYFARYQTMEMKRAGEAKPFIGQILYKARDDTDDMNARYLPGGRYYTGDLLDYYHVAVITSIKPLRIVECTEYGDVTGIVVSNTVKGWHYGGKLRGVDYNVQEDASADEGGKNMEYSAIVSLKNENSTLNVRNAPGGDVIGELRHGDIIRVMAEGEKWSYVSYDGGSGYVSTSYITAYDPPETIKTTTMIKDDGTVFELVGEWRIAED